MDTTFLRSNQNNKFGVYEKHRVRRRQQGANTSFQHQMWVTETRADGSEETHTIEKTLNAREYYILLKQASPSSPSLAYPPLAIPSSSSLPSPPHPPSPSPPQPPLTLPWPAPLLLTLPWPPPLPKQRDPERCTISKTLSCFIWGTNYWELNAFKGATHVAILEVTAS